MKNEVKANGAWVRNYMAKGKTLEELEKSLVRRTKDELQTVAEDFGICVDMEGTKAVIAAVIVDALRHPVATEDREATAEAEEAAEEAGEDTAEEFTAEVMEAVEEAEEEAEEVPEITALVVTAEATEEAPQAAPVDDRMAEGVLLIDRLMAVADGLVAAAEVAVDVIRAKGPGAVRAAMETGMLLGLAILSIIEALAFWVPEMAHRIGVRLVWVIWPDMRAVGRRAGRTARKYARSAGIAATALLDGFAGLWQMREELVAEYREA